LVEPYKDSRISVYHFDFYRFTHAEEFLEAGLDEYFEGDGVRLVEWPDRAHPYLPAADLEVLLHVAPSGGRELSLRALSPEGQTCLNDFIAHGGPPASGRHAGPDTRRVFWLHRGGPAADDQPNGQAAQTSMLAVRVWPARDYTRVTLESRSPVNFTHQTVRNPERLVVDLEGVELNDILQSLPSKISGQDPYIQLIRAGRNRPGVVRLVIELKAEVTPQVFTLARSASTATGWCSTSTRSSRSTRCWRCSKRSRGRSRGGRAPAPAPGRQTPPDRRGQPKPEPPQARPEAAPHRAAPHSAGGRRRVSRLITIAIDPGHGGEDPGAVGAAGSSRKHVTLSVGRRLKAKIDAQPNMRAMLTRDADYFVPLQQRVAKARRVQADLFVSIHADAFISPTARGSSVFVLSDKGASAPPPAGSKENAADLIGGVNLGVKDDHLARTLLDLSQTASINDSLKVGKAVLGELGTINRLHKGQVEQASFAVLKAPDIPSILVETAFISNPEEEARLNDEAYQDHMAEAIVRGLRRYFAATRRWPSPSWHGWTSSGAPALKPTKSAFEERMAETVPASSSPAGQMDFGHLGRQALETDCESGASPDERLMLHPAEDRPQPIGQARRPESSQGWPGARIVLMRRCTNSRKVRLQSPVKCRPTSDFDFQVELFLPTT
jgi:N-acetylmuramoyl-L-alanine amidase